MASNKRPEGSDVAKKDAICMVDLRSTLQISKQCIANILRQRQPYFRASFTHDSQRAILPLDVAEAKLSYIACAKPQARQHQDDGAIAQATNEPTVTGSDDAVHFLCCET